MDIKIDKDMFNKLNEIGWQNTDYFDNNKELLVISDDDRMVNISINGETSILKDEKYLNRSEIRKYMDSGIDMFDGNDFYLENNNWLSICQYKKVNDLWILHEDNVFEDSPSSILELLENASWYLDDIK